MSSQTMDVVMPVKRRAVPSPAEAAIVAESLLGLDVTKAVKAATRRGFRIRDMTVGGWYTQELDRRRINVTTNDAGQISTATPDVLDRDDPQT